MNYINFNPSPALGINTNVGAVLLRMIETQDNALLTQSASSIIGLSAAGQGYFRAIADALKSSDKDFLLEQENYMRSALGNLIIPNISKPYDATFTRRVERERAITIDVPKVRKVGFFKKESYIDRETKVEKYCDVEEITYKGWRIERLSRKEVYDWKNYEELFIDYFLGEDGEFYTVLYSNDNNKNSDYTVGKCIFLSPLILNYKFCNIFISAFSGVLGVLDAIPMDMQSPQRNIHFVLDSNYYYNYPIQVESADAYPYKLFNGVLNRCVELLDEGELKADLKKIMSETKD